MGVSKFLVPFYPINIAWVVFSSDLNMDPQNVFPNGKGVIGYGKGDEDEEEGEETDKKEKEIKMLIELKTEGKKE